MLSNLSGNQYLSSNPENRKYVFNLIKYAKFKLKIEEVRRSHTTTCGHEKKQEKVFYLVYLLNYS